MITTSIQPVGVPNHIESAKDEFLRDAIALAQRINHRLAERAPDSVKTPVIVDEAAQPPALGA
jgi:hypothetical protein